METASARTRKVDSSTFVQIEAKCRICGHTWLRVRHGRPAQYCSYGCQLIAKGLRYRQQVPASVTESIQAALIA